MQIKSNRAKHTAYIHGYVLFGSFAPVFNDAGREIEKKFLEKGKLAFNYSHIRDRDLLIADANSSELDLKIECPYNPNFDFDTNYLVKVRDEFYQVNRYDISNDQTKMFFYLRKAGIDNVSVE